MKLAYGNYGMPHTPPETMARQIAGIGYDGVELCVGPRYPTAPAQLDGAGRARLRDLLGERGIEIASFMITGIKALQPDAAQHQANLAALRRVFELASDLGVDQPVVSGTIGGRIGDVKELGSLMVDRIGDWAATAGECGGIFAFEPHVGGMIHSPDLALWLLKTVNHPCLKVKFDYSHFELIDVPLQEAIAKLAPYTVDVHVKDVSGRYPNFKFLLPGQGQLDYADYLRQMAAAGYDGFITVEISGMVFNAEGYDPLAAAEFSYRTLAAAFDAAGVRRE